MLPPEEEKVYIEFRDPKQDQRIHRVTIPWRIASIYSKTIQEMQRGADMMTGTARGASGYDFMTQLVHIAKKHFIVPGVAKREAEGVEQSTLPRELIPGFEEPLFPNHLKTKKCVYNGAEYGYIRVYSFDVEDDQAFAKDFKRLVDTAPKAGLIIDLRNNGGGNILAAECMLQSLSTKLIDPAPAQFVNRPLVEYLLKMHSPSQRVKGLDLTNWNDRLRVMRQTGSTYSLAFPLTPVELLRQYRSSEKLNVVLITDALCYSATDIFAAGFQDHELGEVLGVHENTGAGGANVWTHWILNMLTTEDQSSPYFTTLPYGADMRVAVRRMLRVGKNAGIPLEDLGVVPTHRHEMTRTDLLQGNKDLVAHACRILSA
jgi:hypothetical protein